MFERNNTNECRNWTLRCHTMKATENGLILHCMKAGKRKEDGTYAPSMWIDVFCGANTDIARIDWEKKYILVDGNFSIGEWVKQDRTSVLTFTIFATRVTERIFEN